MRDRSGTAIVLASGRFRLFSEWSTRSWPHLIGARLVLVPYGGETENICSSAPSGTEICLPDIDTSLEANRNKAIRSLALNEPDFIVFLDDDTFVDPVWLDAMLEAASRFRETAAFASVVRSDGSSNIQACGHILEKAAPHDLWLKQPGGKDQIPLCPCGNSAFVRWSAIKNIERYDANIWDPRFNQWQTCFDFGLKMVLTGSATSLVRKAEAQHRGYKTWSDSEKEQKRDAAPLGQLTSRFLLYRKFLSAELLIAAERQLELRVKSWESEGYPGFKQWLSGEAIRQTVERARTMADELWKKRPDETWKQLTTCRLDARTIWNL